MNIIRVVLEVEELPDGDRVHLIGVFNEGEALPRQRYNYRNVVQTWMSTEHDVNAFFLAPRQEEVR